MKLFYKNIYNIEAYNKLKESNKELTRGLNMDLKTFNILPVNEDIIKEIATDLLLRTHDPTEIIELIQEYKQLRGAND